MSYSYTNYANSANCATSVGHKTTRVTTAISSMKSSTLARPSGECCKRPSRINSNSSVVQDFWSITGSKRASTAFASNDSVLLDLSSSPILWYNKTYLALLRHTVPDRAICRPPLQYHHLLKSKEINWYLSDVSELKCFCWFVRSVAFSMPSLKRLMNGHGSGSFLLSSSFCQFSSSSSTVACLRRLLRLSLILDFLFRRH